MMSEWELTSLEEIVKFSNGKKRPKENGTIPVYGGNGILDYTSQCNYERCVIIGRVGAYCGSVYYENGQCWVSDNAIAALPKSKTNIKFIYYLLKNLQLNMRCIGTGQPLLTQGILNSIECHIPNETEQIKIAEILSQIDDKIALNTAINENLEQQAQAIFKSWFIDFEPFGGVMPDDWVISTLGEVSEMGAGGDKPNNATIVPTKENTIPIYSNGLTDEGLYGFTNKAKIFEESVTVSARGTIGYVCLRQIPYVPIVRLVTLIPYTDILSAKYLYLWLRNLHITGTGTTQQQLTVPDFKKAIITIPNNNIMNKFTNTITPFYNQILANKSENQRLSALRDTLLPKLMNGEIDVSEVKL